MEKYVCPHQIPGCPDQIHKPLPMYVIMIGAADLDKQLRKEIARIVGFIPNTEWQLDFLHNLDFHKFWKIASWIHNIFCNSPVVSSERAFQKQKKTQVSSSSALFFRCLSYKAMQANCLCKQKRFGESRQYGGRRPTGFPPLTPSGKSPEQQ